jgi:molybdenum cofactor biosynthesis protein B
MSQSQSLTATVLVGVISSTRGLDADEGGATLVAGLEKAGHKVLPRVAVDGSSRSVRCFVLDAQDQRNVDVVVLVGGAGLAPFDHSYEAVTGFFDKELPGFGEALRGTLLPQLRARTVGIRAAGGVIGSLLVFVLPGEQAVCQVAGAQLIGPALGDLLSQLKREPPADEDILEVVPEEEPLDEEEPDELDVEEEIEEPPPEGWMRRLHEMGGVLDKGQFPGIPAWLEDLAAAQDVLNNAGKRGHVTLPQGEYVALGFPDLSSPQSRVLLLGLGSPRGEILAIHRWPMRTGICSPRVGGVIPHRGRMGSTAEEVTGRDYPGEGRLFGLDSKTAYVLDGVSVQGWDGKNKKDHGREASALASLLLRWTQR